MKIFKISDYIPLFKDFIINNFTEIINDANKYLDETYISNYLKQKFSLMKMKMIFKGYIFRIL